MATNPHSTVSSPAGPKMVSPGRRTRQRNPGSLKGRVFSTVLALIVLALALRYLPPGARNAQAGVKPVAVQAGPADLHYSDLQMSEPPGAETLYLDGLVTNQGTGTVTGATAEVEFMDAQGRLIASVHTPLVGMANGGTDLIQNEFARNPITPSEVRFFRVAVAVEQVPANWNREVPTVKIVSVTSR